MDAAENESAKSEAVVFTTEAEKDTEAPTAPTEVKATNAKGWKIISILFALKKD